MYKQKLQTFCRRFSVMFRFLCPPLYKYNKIKYTTRLLWSLLVHSEVRIKKNSFSQFFKPVMSRHNCIYMMIFTHVKKLFWHHFATFKISFLSHTILFNIVCSVTRLFYQKVNIWRFFTDWWKTNFETFHKNVETFYAGRGQET